MEGFGTDAVIWLKVRLWSSLFCSSSSHREILRDKQEFFEPDLSNSLQYRVIVLACEQALLISAEGRAILRLREDLIRVGERFVGSLVSISVPDPSLARVSHASYAFKYLCLSCIKMFGLTVCYFLFYRRYQLKLVKFYLNTPDGHQRIMKKLDCQLNTVETGALPNSTDMEINLCRHIKE